MQVSSSLKDKKIEKREGSQEFRRLTEWGVREQLIGDRERRGQPET